MWGSAVQVCSGLPLATVSVAFRPLGGRESKTGAVHEILQGGLAQLARAPALQAGGQRFESVILHTGYRPWTNPPGLQPADHGTIS